MLLYVFCIYVRFLKSYDVTRKKLKVNFFPVNPCRGGMKLEVKEKALLFLFPLVSIP